jgi:predicted ester cyclase
MYYLYLIKPIKTMRKLITGMAIVACFFAACKGNSGSATTNGSDSTATALKKNKQTALNSDMGYNNKSADAVCKDYAPDFIDYGSGEYPPSKNLDSIKAETKSFIAAYPDIKGENLVAVADSNTVIVTGTWSGTFKGEFMKIKPTGKLFKVSDADIFTFNKDGKIASHRSIQSLTTIFTQLGIPLPKKM